MVKWGHTMGLMGCVYMTIRESLSAAGAWLAWPQTLLQQTFLKHLLCAERQRFHSQLYPLEWGGYIMTFALEPSEEPTLPLPLYYVARGSDQ